MRRSINALVLLSVSLAACQPLASGSLPSANGEILIPVPTQVGGAEKSPSAVLPVYVYAVCTQGGESPRQEIPKGRPVIVLWGWVATSMQMMQDYMDAATVAVTLDGEKLDGRMQGEVQYDAAESNYKAVWSAQAGVPAAGTHVLTYLVKWTRKIFDGTDYYGPGSPHVTLSDRCEIVVK